MTAPEIHKVLLQPPHPGMRDNPTESFKFDYELWKRSGEFEDVSPNLNGLEASVTELNTLVGVETGASVQEQLDLKVNSASLGDMAYQEPDNISVTGGSLEAVTVTGANISDSIITIRAGSLSLQLNGIITSNTTPVGNVGLGEDTLITYSLPADTLLSNQQFIEVECWGVFAANANNKRIKLKFGTTTLLDTTAVAANSGSWWIKSKIIRTASAAQQVISEIISDNSNIVNGANYVDATEDLTTALNVFCTGEAVSNDDIVQKGLTIKWFNV